MIPDPGFVDLDHLPHRLLAAILKNAADKTAPPAQEAPILFLANIRGRSCYN